MRKLIPRSLEEAMDIWGRNMTLSAGTLFGMMFLAAIWQYLAKVPSPTYLFTGVPSVFEIIAYLSLILMCFFGLLFMDGVISDYEVTEEMLSYFINKANGMNRKLLRPVTISRPLHLISSGPRTGIAEPI